MLVTYWMPPTSTAPVGWLRISIGTWPRHSREFWANTRPTYSSIASPTAATLRGQLWTTMARRRLTDGRGRWRPAWCRHRVRDDPGGVPSAGPDRPSG